MQYLKIIFSFSEGNFTQGNRTINLANFPIGPIATRNLNSLSESGVYIRPCIVSFYKDKLILSS